MNFIRVDRVVARHCNNLFQAVAQAEIDDPRTYKEVDDAIYNACAWVQIIDGFPRDQLAYFGEFLIPALEFSALSLGRRGHHDKAKIIEQTAKDLQIDLYVRNRR